MDRRTIAAIALCVLFLLFYPQIIRWAGLGRYMEPQRRTAVAPDTSRGVRPQAGAPSPLGPGAAGNAAPQAGKAAPPTGRITPAAEAQPERLIHVDAPLYDATFSTRGARLVSVTLKRYAAAYRLTGKNHVHRDRNGDYPPDRKSVV